MEENQRRWEAAIATFDSTHGTDDGSRLIALRIEGRSEPEIAAEMRVTTHQIDVWSSEITWLSLGYPPELAQIRAASEHTKPRDKRTTAVFDDLVRNVFAVPLKEAGFRKQRQRWTRQLDHLEQVVDIQRHWSTGDLLSFTSNIVVVLVDLQEIVGSPRRAAASLRIGDFFDGFDRWWSIQLGRLARDCPTVLDDADACRNEIADGVDRVVQWMDDTTTVPSLVNRLRELPREPLPLFALDEATLERLARHSQAS